MLVLRLHQSGTTDCLSRADVGGKQEEADVTLTFDPLCLLRACFGEHEVSLCLLTSCLSVCAPTCLLLQFNVSLID